MMKPLATCLLLLRLLLPAHGQGTFTNLDFESANLSSYSPGPVPATEAIPGWTAFSDGSAVETIGYNTGGLIAILSATTIQGNYYVHLQGQRGLAAAIGQTATIPDTSQSLIFWGYVNLATVSLSGQDLSLVLLGQTQDYHIYGADISGFAGHTSQLLFSTTGTAFADIDNIQFSPSAIPEPATGALLVMVMAAVGFWRSQRVPNHALERRCCPPSQQG